MNTMKHPFLSQDVWRFTLLGTGSSGGVPRIGNDWGVCDPAEPKNHRLRCCAMVERVSAKTQKTTRILIDTSPDIRQQLLRADVSRIDAVVYSHHHADQVGGIDDLRVLAIRQKSRIPVYMDRATSEELTYRAAYCFKGEGGYPPILERQPDMEPLQRVPIEGLGGNIEIIPLEQYHGEISSLGFKIGNLAYCNDIHAFPEESLAALRGIDTFIIDALRPAPHPSHAHLDQAIAWAQELGARRTILTNMHIDMDYQSLKRSLPEGIEPGYDGLNIDFCGP